jgi:hypothetical protein
MTIGVIYEGALGNPASSSPLARSTVAREPFQAGQNTGRSSRGRHAGGALLHPAEREEDTGVELSAPLSLHPVR